LLLEVQIPKKLLCFELDLIFYSNFKNITSCRVWNKVQASVLLTEKRENSTKKDKIVTATFL
jgi:hypothetical protein